MIKSVIFGCEGTTLSDMEKSFFERTQPLGIILFERNCASPEQLRDLIHSIKEVISHEHCRILIDREGGRITRLPHTHWRIPPAAQVFGDLYDENEEVGLQGALSNALLMGHELKSLGINVNCAPIADLPSFEAHPVIGTRAFNPEIEPTVNLALSVIEGLQHQGITPVLKHLPGHGRALVDSHTDLPVVTASKSDLYSHDFECFRQILEAVHHTLRPVPWGMTAHVIYEAIDPHLPATLSASVIDYVVRGFMDFQGFLVTDCLTMKALKGTMAERATFALDAGCDAVLHCNGDIDEMIDIAAVTPPLEDESMERLEASIPEASHTPLSIAQVEKDLHTALHHQEDVRKVQCM